MRTRIGLWQCAGFHKFGSYPSHDEIMTKLEMVFVRVFLMAQPVALTGLMPGSIRLGVDDERDAGFGCGNMNSKGIKKAKNGI